MVGLSNRSLSDTSVVGLFNRSQSDTGVTVLSDRSQSDTGVVLLVCLYNMYLVYVGKVKCYFLAHLRSNQIH